MAKKVLIVEDDSNIAELLHLYLEKEGFETQVARDGGKGVRAAEDPGGQQDPCYHAHRQG